MVDISIAQDASALMNAMLKNAKEENLEDGFQNTSVKNGKPNNYQGVTNPKADKVVGEAAKDKKPKASKANMLCGNNMSNVPNTASVCQLESKR
mgnify:CR=1 FL=1